MISTEPRLDRSNVAALIPAYREEKHIAEVVRRTRLQLDHVVVVDDGSPDATAFQARDAGAEVVVHDVNRGKGAAIKTGLRELAGRGFAYILILDADGQHLPEEIPRFLEKAGITQSRFIVGSRMSDTRKMPLARKLTNRFMSWQISRLCGQPIPDTQCGFRMIHRDLVPDLLCESDAFEYETEMLFIAAKRGYRISSVPISTVYGDEKSKIRPLRDTIQFFRLLARYRRK
jgi:glycosyltransferase involved in cell wall biosynthesis